MFSRAQSHFHSAINAGCYFSLFSVISNFFTDGQQYMQLIRYNMNGFTKLENRNVANTDTKNQSVSLNIFF